MNGANSTTNDKLDTDIVLHLCVHKKIIITCSNIVHNRVDRWLISHTIRGVLDPLSPYLHNLNKFLWTPPNYIQN